MKSQTELKRKTIALNRYEEEIMVSNMNIEPRAEICDINRPALTNSAISQSTIECHINPQSNGMVDADELTKRVLKLDLSQQSEAEKGSFDSDEKADMDEVKSPKSPQANPSGEYPSVVLS